MQICSIGAAFCFCSNRHLQLQEEQTWSFNTTTLIPQVLEASMPKALKALLPQALETSTPQVVQLQVCSKCCGCRLQSWLCCCKTARCFFSCRSEVVASKIHIYICKSVFTTASMYCLATKFCICLSQIVATTSDERLFYIDFPSIWNLYVDRPLGISCGFQ